MIIISHYLTIKEIPNKSYGVSSCHEASFQCQPHPTNDIQERGKSELSTTILFSMNSRRSSFYRTHKRLIVITFLPSIRSYLLLPSCGSRTNFLPTVSPEGIQSQPLAPLEIERVLLHAIPPATVRLSRVSHCHFVSFNRSSFFLPSTSSPLPRLFCHTQFPFFNSPSSLCHCALL